MARLITLLFSLLVMALAWGCAAQKGPSDLEAARTQAESEFNAWLTKPDVQKAISDKNLTGTYVYTLVIDHKGQVQTVYADDNPDTEAMHRQNEMTRLLRTFTSTIRLLPNERVKFQPRFKV